MAELQVSELIIYPVKSTGHISLQQTKIDNFGLIDDRRWMLVDEQGDYISQRKHPRLCLIKTSLEPDGLILRAPEMPDFRVTNDQRSDRITVTIWDDKCSAVDCGDEVAAWLKDFMGQNSRLVYFPENEKRQIDQQYGRLGEYTAFSDGFPILLISQGSLDDLNNKLDKPVPMIRFRPNIVVSGCEGFAEDNWKRIKIGSIELRIVKPCSRCIIPNIDTVTAKRGKEPAYTLSQYRKRDNKIYFGQNVIATDIGQIAVGMPVEIIE